MASLNCDENSLQEIKMEVVIQRYNGIFEMSKSERAKAVLMISFGCYN